MAGRRASNPNKTRTRHSQQQLVSTLMKMQFGNGKTKYGPGVSIELDGNEVALAIDAWLVANGVHVSGPRTITVNGELCKAGNIYVDPSGFVITPKGRKLSGRVANVALRRAAKNNPQPEP